MKIENLDLPSYFKERYSKFPNLTPIQAKSIEAGLLEKKSQLICAPTASGKTLIATMAISDTIGKGKAIYVVPLKALANEKYNEFKEVLKNTEFTVIQSTGDIDSASEYLAKYDVLVVTAEKLDSLLRHKVSWLHEVKTVIVDEIHLLNDPSRGPTVEIILTMLKMLINPQLIGLSATIGNPQALADWLDATLVIDDWRPVELKQGIASNGEIEFY
jgi:helicase